MKLSLQNIANFLFELGMLKKIEHAGIKFAGVKHPDTIGEHACRAAQLGFILAQLEAVDPWKVAFMCLIHDNGEIRIGDMHRIADRYLDTKRGEMKAFLDQTKNLPDAIGKDFRSVFQEFNRRKTREAVVARDADLLETMLQAKEYLDAGYRGAKRWLHNGGKYLKTKTAKKLFRIIEKTEFTQWWDKLNKV